MKKVRSLFPHAIAIFGAAVFLDSLRFKFTDHSNTEVIFGRLNEWAGTIGFPGLFAHSGLFSQYIIGSVELVAATFLLLGLLPRLRRYQFLGAVLAFCIMSGAVFFHLFTPLGTDPNNDGGGLFIAALIVWIGSAVLAVIRGRELLKK